MTPHRYTSIATSFRALRRIVLAASLALVLGNAASAQAPRGVYAPGQAAVTGFSGALRPFEMEPGQDADARTFIDSEGPSLRVVDLSRMGGPPEAQLVGAPKPFTVSAKWIGQVFGIALDDGSPANIYVAATSAYGLSIVAPGGDGKSQHVRTGTNGATFMSAQWGPAGGPGSIWKISGLTGEVGLFANVTTGGKANSGAALGALAYDRATKSLFVADRETGLIHRFGANGADLGTYDHGVSGTSAVGLAQVAQTASIVDITSPQFDSARPETWGYAAPGRRVFGLAVRDRRLYYAVAEGLRVWSVGLKPDGSFGTDIRIEIVVPPAAGPTEISGITFDDEGRIYLAERAAPTGAQDFEALTVPSIGRVLRYTVIGVTAAKQPIWQAAPDEYAIGFPGNFRNDNGGVAIGYSYDERGNINPRSCGGFLWTTGEQLRHATDPQLAAQIGQPDAVAIDGLQGNPIWRIKRDAESPRLSYFIDYADAPPDLSARGHLGDIAILRACGVQPAQLPPGMLPVGVPLPPPNFRTCQTHVCNPPGTQLCAVNQVWSKGACASGCAQSEILVNGKCCSPVDLGPGGACSSGGGSSIPSTNIAKVMCGNTQTAIGPNHECCENDHIYSGSGGTQLCCADALVNGMCQPFTPKIPSKICLDCCSPGYVKTGGKCCLKSQATAGGVCCPIGQKPSADGTHCQTTFKIPKISFCCAAGYVPTVAGKCCAAGNLTTTGECCPTAVNPNDRRQCLAQSEKKSFPPQICAPGETRDEKGACVARRPTPSPITPIPTPTPKPRQPSTQRPSGERAPGPINCPPGTVPGPLGQRCWPIGRGHTAPLAPGRVAPGRVAPVPLERGR
ncbi:hypothetical protein [uncultured Bradyrhizobium sp.]|jgi:hypothetical protein|uniref:hypothetical protein n=1 Tax=uncultured Bradyrhizobium sp. TaxID=199684 RepID=UPI00261754C1|nr:hypothetical protein [uncultured Bradyrhizobium sp.]